MTSHPTLAVTVAAPPAQAEIARQGLIATFMDRDGGRFTPHGAPAGARALSEAPLASFALATRDVDPARARAALGGRFAGQPIDWCVAPTDDRVKRVMLCDMDSTIIGVECIDVLADALGVGEKVAAITEKAMRGELNFEESLRERVRALKGAKLDVLEKVWEKRVRPAINPGAAALVATMKTQGAFTALVSGGFTFFVARVAAALGFDSVEANTLLDHKGKLTGEVREPILGPDAKREALNRLAYAHSDGPEHTLAIGDGANDLAMVKAAGLGVAYRAKPILAKAADGHIQSGDLRAALLFQGLTPGLWVDVG